MDERAETLTACDDLRMHTSRSLSLFVAVLIAAAAEGQQRTAGESIEVAITNVDVVVTDREGNRVRGLSKDDFEIREGGRVQPVTNFAEYAPADGVVTADLAAPGEIGPASALATPERRSIVIFIEAFKTRDFRSKPLFDAFRSMLREVVRPGDAVAVAMFTGSLVIVQEFTGDIAKLEAAIDTVEASTTGVAHDATAEVRRQNALEEQAVRNMNRADDPFNLLGDLPGEKSGRGKTRPTDHMHDVAGGEKLRRAKYELLRIRQKADAAAALIESIGGVSGRKVLIMATERFGRHAGAAFYDGKVPERHAGELDTKEIRERLTGVANANGVTIYTLYPVEVDSRPRNEVTEVRAEVYKVDAQADAVRSTEDMNLALNETASLTEIAGATGGRMASGAAGIVELLPLIADDLQSYYSLAYRSGSSPGKGRRDIEVRTKDRSLTVRARRQLVRKAETAKMHDRVVGNLYRPSEQARLPISASAGSLTKVEGNRWSLPVSVRIPIGSLTLTPGNEGHAGTFSVFVASAGPLGLTSEVQEQKQRFAIPPADLERARASHFTYDLTIEVDAASDKVTVGVQDEVSAEFGLAVVHLPEKP